MNNNELNLTYTERDGLLYPNIQIADNQPLGLYGRTALKYWKENKRDLYQDYLIEGTLMTRLHKLEERVGVMIDQLMEKMLEENPMPAPKKTLERVQHMNSIRAKAEEVVLSELIYS